MRQMLHVQPVQAQNDEMNSRRLNKWFNSEVMVYHGNLAEIRSFVPQFERRTFALTQPDNDCSVLNDRLDMIVRKPFGESHDFVPVGVVSKEYALLPHSIVLEEAAKALVEVKIDMQKVNAVLVMSEYGERMALSIYFPDEYSFDPGDGHPMALRLECFNSVDGSSRFRALMGWFRFVCSNGLVIGVTKSDMRRRHVGDIGIQDIGEVVKAGMKDEQQEQKNFKNWRQKPIAMADLKPWTDDHLKKAWGFKAAARFYHIANTGHDAKIIGPYKDNTPTCIPVEKTEKVPGAPSQSKTFFDVSQTLAWLAKERRDVQEQLAWRESIQDLISPLLN